LYEKQWNVLHNHKKKKIKNKKLNEMMDNRFYEIIRSRNKKDLHKFIKDNRSRIKHTTELYKTAIKSNNLFAIKLLYESYTRRQKATELLSRIVILLVKYNKYEFLKHIFEYYIFDNSFIIKFLLFYKNKQKLANNDINNLISKEKSKINLCMVDDEDYLPLVIACENGNEKIVEFLVERGADINKDNDDGYSPLVAACLMDNENIVKYLIDHGAELNNLDEHGCNPLISACENGNENIVKYLVEHGEDVNEEKNGYGNTPLITACDNGCETIVKYLVEHGADVNKNNNDGDTPLISACNIEYENIVSYLIEHGADVNKCNNYGDTPLIAACECSNLDIVKNLIEHGADIHQGNKDDYTPIMAAHEFYDEGIINYLIEHGAKPLNKKQKTIKLSK